MKSRLLNLRSCSRSSTSINVGQYLVEPIPIDIIIEILLRSPLKSIARCRCVSKLWSSILRLPYFLNLFLTRPYVRPKLLFACQDNDDEVCFFSVPQPQNPDENSPPLVANYRMRIPCDFVSTCKPYYSHSMICSPINSGLVYIRDDYKKRFMICNPSTGQSFPLLATKNIKKHKRSFCGYDPIEKQFKVLSITSICERFTMYNEHQVLTLGSEKLSWRMIKCGIPPHSPEYSNICINGVLYYKAYGKGSIRDPEDGVICFDVRSERYSFLSVVKGFHGATLKNYNGKLASFKPDKWFSGFEIYILEDPEKQEWSHRVYKLPSLWKNVVGEFAKFRCVGVTGTNDIVLLSRPRSLLKPLYIFYINIERNTLTWVEIQGMEAFRLDRVWIFVDHVDDLKLMNVV